MATGTILRVPSVNVFFSINDMGLTNPSEGIVNIIGAMPNGSMAVLDAGEVTERPADVSWGIVVIIKYHNNRTAVKFVSQLANGGKYYEYGGSVASGLFTGWKTIYAGT